MIKQFFHSYSTVVVGFMKSTNLEKCIHIFCFSILCIKETLLKAAVIKLFKQYIIVDFLQTHTHKKSIYVFKVINILCICVLWCLLCPPAKNFPITTIALITKYTEKLLEFAFCIDLPL